MPGTPVGSQSAQSAHAPACEPTDPTVSQLDVEPDNSDFSPADGRHSSGTLHPGPGPEDDTKMTKVTAHTGMSSSSPSLSPSGDQSHDQAASGAASFTWTMEADPVGPCIVCTHACYSHGPDGRPAPSGLLDPQHPTRHPRHPRRRQPARQHTTPDRNHEGGSMTAPDDHDRLAADWYGLRPAPADARPCPRVVAGKRARRS